MSDHENETLIAALEPFAIVSSGQSDVEDPKRREEVYRALIRINRPLVEKLMEVAETTDSPDSYVRGFCDVLGGFVTHSANVSLEQIFTETMTPPTAA